MDRAGESRRGVGVGGGGMRGGVGVGGESRRGAVAEETVARWR